MKLHSQVLGSGPDLIVLHGLFGSRQNWQSLARRFSGQFRVHTVDLRNHGASPHHDQVDYPLMAGDVVSFLRQAEISRAHLLGHSLGGKVAMQCALLRPDLVNKLVVVDMAPRAYASTHDEVFAALRELPLSRIRTRTEADELLAARIPHHATRRFLLANLERTAEGGFRWRVNLEALHAQREQLTAPVTGTGCFTGPTLFVRGERSDYLRETDRAPIEHWFPRARIETIEGAGHWVHVDAPEAFYECVSRFLQAAATA